MLKQNYMGDSQIEQSNKNIIWDPYIEKQLYHLVVELKFNFQAIAQKLSSICSALGQKQVSQRDCEMKWTQIHQRRLITNDQRQLQEEQVKSEKMRRCIESFQNPNSMMTVNELIAKLPNQRENKDFLKILKIDQFNSLKESVRGNLDSNVRKQDMQSREDAFLQQLDSIGQSSDRESDKPQIFKVQFDQQGGIIVQKQILNQESVQSLMMQKVDMARLGGLRAAEPFIDENYVSQFTKPKQAEISTVNNTVVEQQNNQINDIVKEYQNNDEISNVNLKLIENGDITLNDAVIQLSNLESCVTDEQQQVIELPVRPLDKKTENQVQQILKEKIVQIQQKRQPDTNSDSSDIENQESSEEDDFLETQRQSMKHDEVQVSHQSRNQIKKQGNKIRDIKKKVKFADNLVKKQNLNQNHNRTKKGTDNQIQSDDDIESVYQPPPDPIVDQARSYRDELIERQRKREELKRLKELQEIEEYEQRLKFDQDMIEEDDESPQQRRKDVKTNNFF